MSTGKKCDKCGCSEFDKPNKIGIVRFDVAQAFAKVYEDEAKHWGESYF